MVQIPRWQSLLILFVVLMGGYFALPNALDRELDSPVWNVVPDRQLNLGLDLRGGSYFLVNVDTRNVVTEYLEGLISPIRSELRAARITFRAPEVENDVLIVQPRDAGLTADALAAIRDVAGDVEMRNTGDRIEITLPDAQRDVRIQQIVEQSVEVIRRRIDTSGLVEPSIQRQQQTRILVQLPGVDDPQAIRNILNQTAKLEFRLVDVSHTGGPAPAGATLLPMDDNPAETMAVRNQAIITGDMLTDSQATFDENSRPAVSFRFDAQGTRNFAATTAENVGRPFAIVLDDKIISAPVIQVPILGGSGIITGQFATAETQQLSALLRAGALPAPLVVLEERTVGPGLGADSIEAGTIACLIGLAGVLIFMVLMYGRYGLFANVALIVNLVLIVGILSLLQATLTLPGIAGIVLTIGMAVDANVLVFERIREEFSKTGRLVKSVENGYKAALVTIIDANLTTLIAAVILWAFGTGPVKGFATTLGIGVLSSMFTALMLTRWLIALWLRNKENDEFSLVKSAREAAA